MDRDIGTGAGAAAGAGVVIPIFFLAARISLAVMSRLPSDSAYQRKNKMANAPTTANRTVKRKNRLFIDSPTTDGRGKTVANWSPSDLLKRWCRQFRRQ